MQQDYTYSQHSLFYRAMHYSAKRGLAIACRLSVCPSVCLYVCDVGGSVSHRSEILETNCTDTYRNTFALRSPKANHLLPGEHGEILRRLEVGLEKMALWSTKAAISLKRAQIEEKLLWGAHRNSPSLFRMVPFPNLYGLPFQKIGGTHPTQNSNHYCLGNG